MQETRLTASELCPLEDKSIKGWQLIWSGHKRKKHRLAILRAPHVTFIKHDVLLDARIIIAKVEVGNFRLALLHAYAPSPDGG